MRSISGKSGKTGFNFEYKSEYFFLNKIQLLC